MEEVPGADRSSETEGCVVDHVVVKAQGGVGR